MESTGFSGVFGGTLTILFTTSITHILKLGFKSRIQCYQRWNYIVVGADDFFGGLVKLIISRLVRLAYLHIAFKRNRYEAS